MVPSGYVGKVVGSVGSPRHFDSRPSFYTHSSFKPFIPYPHSRHHRSTRTHVLLSLSPHTIRRRHAAASSCTSCVPHGRTTGPTSPGTALLCYSDVFCVCFVRPSAQGRLLLRVLRAFRLLRCVKLSYQLASQLACATPLFNIRPFPPLFTTDQGVG